MIAASILLGVFVAVGEGDLDARQRQLFLEARTVLERHCLECHHGAEPDGGLSLTEFTHLTRGGDSGPAVVPTKVAESLLIDMVAGEKPEMPKKRPPLKPEQVETLRRWIAAGAPWQLGIKLADRRFDGATWWSLEPLVRPEIPDVTAIAPSADWKRNPVDAFILTEQHKHGLVPSPEADPRTLIRRLYFDLLGLPPTPEEIHEFRQSAIRNPQSSMESLVDRLLSSPAYGERWARHWLDVVHYGETHGFDKDKPRNNAWPYRDYVIRAFNEDRKYDRFVQEQVAGDVLFPGTPDGIEALGFIAAGPWDFIGHAEVPETKTDGKIARHLDRDDMITNTIQSFCSLTIQCAQCHNHKFDPITQEDYYSLQAVFAAVDRTDHRYDADAQIARRRAELVARKSEVDKQLLALDGAVAARLGGELWTLDQQIKDLEKKSVAKGALQGPAYGYHSTLSNQPNTVKWVQVNLAQPALIERIVLRPCFDEFAGIGAGFGFPVRFKVEVADDPQFTTNVRTVYDATAEDKKNPGLSPTEVDKVSQSAQHVRVTATRLAKRQNDYMLALAELEIFDAAGNNVAKGATVTALDSIEAGVRWRRANLVDGAYPADEQAERSSLAELRERRETLWSKSVTADERTQRRKWQVVQAEIDRELKTLPPQQVAYIGAVHTGAGNFRGTGPDGGKPRPIRILARGSVLKPGDEVGPGALSGIGSLPARFTLPTDHTEADRRAALARWLTDRQYPLTWRSIVNRVWQYHFGRGIVETPNDFGRNGARPSHPALLDWLACEFRDGGQSMKKLHKMIVMSATYRQSSIADFGLRIVDSTEQPPFRQANPQSAIGAPAKAGHPQLLDSENRYLWHMNRRRLEAEAVRDSVLQLAGKLDPRMGGPSFQDFVIEKPEHSPHYEYDRHDPTDPRSHRRSIYRFIVRSQQQPFMTTLDCADPSMQVDKRNESLSSLQALALLNNPFMVTMSRHFADRLQAAAPDLATQVERGFTMALGRNPTAEERQRLVAFAQRNGLTNYCRALFNLNEFVFVD